MIGHAHLDGEVVHLVVEQKAERAGGDAGAEGVIEGGGDGDGVALAVDNRIVGGVVAIRRGAGRRWLGAGGRKPGGADQRGAGAWRRRVDARAPGGGILLCSELGHGNAVVVRVAEVLGAVHVGAAKGLRDEVDGGGGAVAEPGQVVAFQNIERAHQHDSAGRRRRGAEDGVVVKAADDGRALERLSACCWRLARLVLLALNADASTLAEFTSAATWLLLAAFTFLLPGVSRQISTGHPTLLQRLGWDAFVLLKKRDHRVVFITVALFGIPLAAFYPFTPLHLQALGFKHVSAWMTLAQTTELFAMFALAGLFLRWRLK